MASKINIGDDLQDLLLTKNLDPKITNKFGQETTPSNGTTFSFDYVSSIGKNYGTAVIVLGDNSDLMLFFGDNLGRSMENPEDKNEWYEFMRQLKDFSVRHNFQTFTPKNLNQIKHTLAGIAAIKEGLFEGYYGTRKISYAGQPTEARLMIRHNQTLGENDARYRHVESLFIETVDGERFKLPFRSLTGGRAMLEHVRQGGKPYDVRGCHIAEMVSEIAVLSRFNRASSQRILEGTTQALVTEAQAYYKRLKEGLKHMGSARGYKNYFESWHPATIDEQEELVEDIKTLFIEQTIDSRIEAALPVLAKIQQGNTMKEADIFESWINNLAEGTWALPDTPEAKQQLADLLASELPVGPDAENATEQLYDVFGDDQLFDALQELAKEDANADARPVIIARMEEIGLEVPGMEPSTDATKPTGDPDPEDLGSVDVEQGVAEGAEEELDEALNKLLKLAQVPVAEARIIDESGETLEHILDRFKFEVRQFEQDGELDTDLYEALFDYYFNAGEMPYGTAKARTGDPYEWVSQRLYDDLGLNEGNNMATFEGDTEDAIAAFLNRGGEIQQGKYHKPRKSEKTDYGSKHIGGMRDAVAGKAGKTLGRAASTNFMGGGKAVVGEESVCNHTMEGEYCPEHGLVECGYMESTGGTVAGAIAPLDEGSGYDGSEPLDLSTNPSVNDVFKRALHIYSYDGYSNDMDYSEDDAIDQYVERKFGQDVLDQLNKARYQSYFGRDDDRGTGGYRGDNLGRASAPGSNFRTTKAGKMHGQDAKSIKAKVSNRLGRHPEPILPEDSTDPMDNRGAVTDSFYEDLDRLKKLALVKRT